MNKQDKEVYEAVLKRDRIGFWLFLRAKAEKLGVLFMGIAEWLAGDPWVCMAPVIDFSQWDRCSGAMERDHVHEHTGGTKGKRPPTTMETLVILCHHHHQNGWATGHRPEIRTYIKEANERYRDISDPSGS